MHGRRKAHRLRLACIFSLPLIKSCNRISIWPLKHTYVCTSSTQCVIHSSAKQFYHFFDLKRKKITPAALWIEPSRTFYVTIVIANGLVCFACVQIVMPNHFFYAYSWPLHDAVTKTITKFSKVTELKIGNVRTVSIANRKNMQFQLRFSDGILFSISSILVVDEMQQCLNGMQYLGLFVGFFFVCFTYINLCYNASVLIDVQFH